MAPTPSLGDLVRDVQLTSQAYGQFQLGKPSDRDTLVDLVAARVSYHAAKIIDEAGVTLTPEHADAICEVLQSRTVVGA